MENRESIMQAIIFKEANWKRIAAMEQIRKGLNHFCVRQIMEASPSVFLPLMCYDDKLLTLDSMLKRFSFDDASTQKNINTYHSFIYFIKNLDVNRMKKLCNVLYCIFHLVIKI